MVKVKNENTSIYFIIYFIIFVSKKFDGYFWSSMGLTFCEYG